jgi:hypothetical protein
MSLETRDFPPVVYVPTTQHDDPAERQVEMRRVDDGRVALFVYSAMDRLHSMFREGTPWLLVDVAQLQRLHDLTPYDLLYLDVVCAMDGAEA